MSETGDLSVRAGSLVAIEEARLHQYGTEAFIRVPSTLLQAIDVGSTGDLASICGECGKKLAQESQEAFDNLFASARRAAGVNKCARHWKRSSDG